MDEQLKKALASIKEFWAKQSAPHKKIIAFSGVGVLLLSLAVVVFLNQQGGQYVTLYTGIDRAEATSVYSLLQDMEVPAQMDNNGNILVPEDAADTIRLELASKGYPKTGLTYDIFSSSSGLTTTESQNRVILTQQLEVRAQDTLARINGVEKAVVTFNLADGTNYVWEAETQKSTASVLLTLYPGTELGKQQVSSIKTLIAGGAPKLLPSDVTVVDAATATELASQEVDVGGLAGELERLGFERQVEKGYEEKAQRQLSLFYGPDMMRVSATVVLNYDKMIQESMTYKPEQGGTGVTQNLHEQYLKDATNYAQGIAGENDNTDVPVIVDANGDGTPEVVSHERDIEFAISYIKSQIEKGKAVVDAASIAIMVKDGDLNQQKKDSIIEQVSKATNIPAGSISVESLEVAPPPTEDVLAEPSLLSDPVMLAVIGLGALSLLVIVFMLFRKRRKKKLTGQEVDEVVLEQQRMQQEMDDKKRMLKDAAEAKNQQENAIADEVRDFAKENPEITAGLIRSWLKEDD